MIDTTNDVKELTLSYKKALNRIFRIFDIDMDGLLSDKELQLLQKHCFNESLSIEDISKIKDIIIKENPKAIQDNALMCNGLEILMKLFLCHNKVYAPWNILRSFGYNDDLTIEVFLILIWFPFPFTYWFSHKYERL